MDRELVFKLKQINDGIFFIKNIQLFTSQDVN